METERRSHSEHFCEGYFAASPSNAYFLGINYSVAKVEKRFSHDGSMGLDQIHAFDAAEVAGAHIGQTNLIQVSSFCGPTGRIWGYDVCKTELSKEPWDIDPHSLGESAETEALSLHSMDPLAEAYKKLTGTVHKPRFPFLPGSHVPCALKYTCQPGPSKIYVAQSCGIPADRARNACLLMEDFGVIPDFVHQQDEYIRDIMINLSKSVLAIGRQQSVKYSQILLGIKTLEVGPNEMGCALAADPYFLLAQLAYPRDKLLSEVSLQEWEAHVQGNFLHRHE